MRKTAFYVSLLLLPVMVMCQDKQKTNSGNSNDEVKSNSNKEAKQSSNQETDIKSSENETQLIEKAKSETPGKSGDSLNFILQGVIEGGGDSEVILDKLGIGADVNPVATSVVNQQGRFRFGGKIPRPGLYQVRLPSQSFHVVLTGGVLHVETDIDNIGDYTVEGDGAKDTRYLKTLYKKLEKFNKMDDSLKKAIDNEENTQKRRKLREKLNKLNKRTKKQKFKALKSIVKKAWDDKSIAAPIIAVRIQLFRDLDFFKKLLRDYKDKYPRSTFVKSLEKKINKTETYLNNHPEEKEKWLD